ncbi:MAG: ThuA domain-containing protein [Planctomycetes bacterium]|nr:ThuA domain-containing protein [Planctomycetota bacterium]
MFVVQALARFFAALTPLVVMFGCAPRGRDDFAARFGYLILLRDQVAAQVCQGRSLEATLAQLLTPHTEDYGRPYLVGVPGREKFARDDREFARDVAVAYRVLTAEPAAPPNDGKPRALALIGDHYHPPGLIRPPIEVAMDDAGIPTEFLCDVTKLTAPILGRYRLLIILRDGVNWPDPDEKSFSKAKWWMTKEQEQAIIAFVRAGGGLLALHNANALKPWAEKQDPAPLLRVLGSQYDSHGAPREGYRVRVLRSDHPITRGVADFTATGEHHRPRPLATDMVRLLESTAEGETCLAGYARTEGKGRIAYLAFGHTREVLDLPDVQRLLANAARWCLGKD